MKPDLQYFAEDGTWVKPLGAERVDVVLRGAEGGRAAAAAGGEGGGATFLDCECIPAARVIAGTAAGSPQGGSPGILGVLSFGADGLPDLVPVTVGRGGQPGGRDGYALVITHLAVPEPAAGDDRLHLTLHEVPVTGEDLVSLAGHFSTSLGKITARWAAEKNAETARLRAEISRLRDNRA